MYLYDQFSFFFLFTRRFRVPTARAMAVPSDITYDEKKALVHKFDSLLLLLYTFLLRHTPTHRTHWKAAREN
jgi:hypothetical protein